MGSQSPSNVTRYDAITIWLHWTTVLSLSSGSSVRRPTGCRVECCGPARGRFMWCSDLLSASFS